MRKESRIMGRSFLGSVALGLGAALLLTLLAPACGRADKRADGPQASSADSSDREAEKQKIAETISNVIGWAKDKNLDLFLRLDRQRRGLHQRHAERAGHQALRRRQAERPLLDEPGLPIRPPRAQGPGDHLRPLRHVAWFYCVLDDINTYKGEPASWENARWTGVVEKRDGKWVVVSQHFSFASDK